MKGMHYREVSKVQDTRKWIQGLLEFITRDELAKNMVEQPLNPSNLQTLDADLT